MQVEEFLQGHPEWFEASAGEYPSWLEYASENRLPVHNLWKQFQISNSIVIERPGIFSTKREYRYDGGLNFRGFVDCCEEEWNRRKLVYGTLDYICSEQELEKVPKYKERADVCYEQVDLDGAVFCLKLCASAGDAPSCRKLGHICYLLGKRNEAKPVSQDAGQTSKNNKIQAASWYRLGASCGDMDCCHCLAWCLLDGEGTDRDAGRAALLLALLADKGYGKAAADLGRLYLKGEQLTANYEKAKRYLDQAAAAGLDVQAESEQVSQLLQHPLT